MKRIVTLITDFLDCDGYMGAIYGVLKSVNPELEIITIAANIPAADIRKASHVLSNSYRFFPSGTIHLVVVDPTVGPKRRPLLIDDGRFCFLGPDNGVFTPVLNSAPDAKIYQITNDKYRLASSSETFHGRDLFAPAAAYLSLGVALDEFGPQITDPVLIQTPQPEKIGHDLIGVIIDIDAFGNLVTNIPARMVNEKSVIAICGKTIHGLSKSYDDVAEKRPLVYIGSSDTLEIAINRGNAANHFGAMISEEVKVIGGAD